MIKKEMFAGNITIYRNYLERPYIKYKTPVATLPAMELATLLTGKYQCSGNVIYGIEVKQ